ncbi:MAG: transposase [Theionarchaea archaeon]|nr:transposase [Theionarchaea archaeon]
MKVPLVVEPEDSKWKLLREVLKCFDSRRFRQEMSKARIRPVPKGVSVIQVTMITQFFSEDISYVVSELKKREKLREFLQIDYVPDAAYIYRFLSRFTEKQFLQMVFGFLNSLCKKRSSQDTLIIDSTDIQIDLNWFRNTIRKKDLEGRDFAWGYSSTKGYYIGHKMTLVVEYPRLRPVYFCLHRGSPNDAKLFLEILEELKRRRILRNGDTIITDKGYCSYDNYKTAFTVYKVIPLIFPRKNMSIPRILSVSYPVDIFSQKTPLEKTKQFFKNLKEKFAELLPKWKDFRPLRGRIEDVFKLLKYGFFKEKIHRYTRKSCYRFVLLGVLLAGVIIDKGFYSQELLQGLAES